MAQNIGNKNTEPSIVFPQAAAELLKEGKSVCFTATGNSMHPTIRQGDTLIIEPCDPTNLTVGDIVLFKDNGRLLAHRIIRIELYADGNTATTSIKTFTASRDKGPLLKSCCRQDAPKAKRSSSKPVVVAYKTQCSSSEPAVNDPQAQRPTKRRDLRFVLRGDFRLNPDPPVSVPQILGKVVSIERNRRLHSPYGCCKRLIAGAYRLASQLKSQLQA